MTAKPSIQRVEEMRARRKALGLTRLELYVHPDDREPVKSLAEKLRKKREKQEQKK